MTGKPPAHPLRRRWLSGALLLVTAVPLGCFASEPDRYLTYDGQAYSADGGKLLYREHHVLRSRDGVLYERLVQYSCPDGRPFARKTLHYGATPLAPDLRFEDARTGASQVLQTTASGRRLRSVESSKARPIETAVPATPDLVADAGFDELIRRSWSTLLAQTPVSFGILLLTDGSVLQLKATHLRHEQLGTEDVEVFRVALSGLLRLIAPQIDVYYSSADHVLRRFEGVSNIRDPAGHQVKAVIDFPSDARHAAGPAAWQDAMSAPLVSSCGP